MNLSYREKSIWGSLITTLVVYGYYFAGVFGRSRPTEINRAALAQLGLAVVFIVAMEIVYHIVIAITSRVDPKDERDIQIEGKAYRNAYFLLVAGLFMLLGVIVLVGMTEFLTVNLMLFSVVAAELLKSLTQLFLYRRGM
jgi:hypothetical protein